MEGPGLAVGRGARWLRLQEPAPRHTTEASLREEGDPYSRRPWRLNHCLVVILIAECTTHQACMLLLALPGHVGRAQQKWSTAVAGAGLDVSAQAGMTDMNVATTCLCSGPAVLGCIFESRRDRRVRSILNVSDRALGVPVNRATQECIISTCAPACSEAPRIARPC